ncbi:MAG: YdbH domain-containing protein [Desulfobacterales bacterium]|nr:YdbH domain-containing protein [Desulfobacterales bacterium]
MPKNEGGGFQLNATGNLSLSDRGITPLPLDLSLNAKVPAKGKPLGFTLTGTNAPMTQFTINRGLPSPVTLLSPAMEFTVKGTPAAQTVSVRWTADRLNHKFPLGSAAANTLTCTADTEGNFLDPTAEKPVKFKANLSNVKTDILLSTNRINRLSTSGEMRFRTDNQKGLSFVSGHIVTTARGIKAVHAGKTVRIAGARLNADLRSVPGPNDQEKLSAALKTVLSDITGTFDENRVDVKDIVASGKVSLTEGKQPRINLDTRISGTTIDLPAIGLNAGGISVRMPVSYPYHPETKPGQLTIQRFTDGRRLNAGLTGVLRQIDDHRISMIGRAESKDIDDFVLYVDLTAGLDKSLVPDIEVAVRSDAFHFTEKALSRVLPDLHVHGTFNIKASTRSHAALKKHVLTTGGRISIHEGSVNMPDMDLNIEGIRGDIIMADLLTPESLPGQTLKISAIDAGQFRFEDAEFRFSVEDGKSLNLENLTLKWCNGIVSTESLRLPDQDGQLHLTLYCDRLEMDSLLRQIGAFDADGGGTLSGRIPVVYRDGDISFENGFLFSTPGQGGRIFVNDIDRLMTGMPKDSPQMSHLDLAAEALKDFQYTWAKLRLNTTGDVLDVNMEIDGKPEKVLPFEYKREMGGFMRVDAKSPGSRFQGVKLDVNLELPFNRVMKFGNKIKSILE